MLLIVNEETDEVDAYRTSPAMLANNEAPIDVSLFLYRDSSSDRQEEEKYNIFWFDTPEGEKSIVKVITNVLGNRQMEMPRPIHVILRASALEGTTLPIYAVSGHLFVMADGSEGGYDLFDGYYQATFDGDTFESNFSKVEGIRSGDPAVTVKKGQEIWPEWTGDATAEDIGGRKYTLSDTGWTEDESQQVAAEMPEGK